MAGRPRSRFRDWAEYLLVRTVTGAFGWMPGRWQLAGARGLALIGFRLMRKRRIGATHSIERRLKLDADGAANHDIAKGACRTLALNFVELGILQRLLRKGAPIGEHLEVEGQEHLRAALESGRGVILCSGHFGAWELFGELMKALGTRIWAVARPLDNPMLQQRMDARRSETLLGTISKVGGGLKMARVLKDGEPIVMLLDQNAGSQGVIMDFLGEPSSHHTVAGVMARRFGAQCLPAYIVREPGYMRFRFVFEPAITMNPALSGEEAELDVVRRVSDSLAARVRKNPEDWLWLHDRWEHALLALAGRNRPSGEPAEVRGVAGSSHVATAQGTNDG